jgi:hypothetical protein
MGFVAMAAWFTDVEFAFFGFCETCVGLKALEKAGIKIVVMKVGARAFASYSSRHRKDVSYRGR